MRMYLKQRAELLLSEDTYHYFYHNPSCPRRRRFQALAKLARWPQSFAAEIRLRFLH